MSLRHPKDISTATGDAPNASTSNTSTGILADQLETMFPSTSGEQEGESQMSAVTGVEAPSRSSLPTCVTVDCKSLIDCAYMHTGESINVFARGRKF